MRSTPKSLVAAGVLALGLSSSALFPGTVQAHVASHAASTKAPSGLPATVAQRAKAKPSRAGYTVRLTTFNILTSSIRAGGVDRAHRAARWAQEQKAVAAAFQEVAKDQLRELQRLMIGYHFYPKRTLGTRGSAIQIAYRFSEVKLVRKGYVMRPFLGHQRPIPWVRLEHRATGRDFFVMAIHNAPGGHEAERDITTRKLIRRISRMVSTNHPVFVIGDVNERSEFCQKVARATPLISMNGGTRRRPCPVPRYGGPDWMLGSAAKFSSFEKVYNGISDHPALTARAKVPFLK